MKLTAFRCLECGHYTISKYDGKRCAECGGAVAPAGNATYADKSQSLIVSVSLKDTEIFKRIITAISDLKANKDTPEWVMEKLMGAIGDKI